jgi:hypothetical protein
MTMSPDPNLDTSSWSGLAALVAALGTAGAALFKGRGQKAEIGRLRTRMHDLDDTVNANTLRIAVVEVANRDITARLDRIEDKLDRLLEQRR